MTNNAEKSKPTIVQDLLLSAL